MWMHDFFTERYETALAETGDLLGGRIPIWGGTWNQPLMGNIIGYSRQAQRALGEFLETYELQVPTRDLIGRQRQFTVDHVAVPDTWIVVGSGKVEADPALSPFDLFCVEAAPASLIS